MKINFYLRFYRGIAGGYKVVYQYANFLAQEGYDVYIYYDLDKGKNKHHLPKFIMKMYRKSFLIGYPKYFSLDKKIKQIGVSSISNEKIRNADVSISTSPQTAHKVEGLKNSKGRKIYFIQGYENWDNSDEYLFESYRFSSKKIVISGWLKEIIDKYSKQKSVIVPNGIDLNKFRIINKPEHRKKHSIAMIYHDAENKGCKYGLEALLNLKNKYDDLVVNMYGAPDRPKELPEWIKYTKNATEDEVVNILNNSSVFMCTSLFEGFGLPGLEAMSCGCAVVTTNCMGPLEYANESNSVICKIKDSKALYNAVEKIFENENFKNKIIFNGKNTSKKWDVETSKKLFAKEIIKEIGEVNE